MNCKDCDTVGPCLVRQSVQKAKFSALCKIRTMQGSILVYSDLKKSRTIQIFLDFSSFSALCKTK